MLLAVLELVANFTRFVDSFLDGRMPLKDTVELTDLRNFCQYRLVSLPSPRYLTHDGHPTPDVQYDVCRLASLGYSLLVIFPLPPIMGLFERLARLLRTEVNNMSDILPSFDHDRMLLHLWVLMVASVISIGLPEQECFFDHLSELMARMHLSTWHEVSAILQLFLWQPSTNNKDGMDILKGIAGREKAA